MTDPAELRARVAQLPSLPGVYRMLDEDGKVLYVGKAKDLRRRVASYFAPSANPGPRIAMMVGRIASFETTITRSEAEALLLENHQIKRHAPRFNIVFRDDKSYPYVVVTGHRFPRIGFHRGLRDRNVRTYGPFPHAHAVREAIQLLQRVFRLRTCEDSVFVNRTRPCLLHQIGRCTAPCTGKIDVPDYAEDVGNAELFLQGREDDVVAGLTRRMNEASGAQRYEAAAALRDQIRALTRIQARQYVESAQGIDADVIACVVNDSRACVNLAMIRGGRNVGDRSFFPQNADDAGEAEVVAAFVEQHYAEQPVPRLVLVSDIVEGTALAELLSERAASPVQVIRPQQGERRVWIDMSRRNATLALEQRERTRLTQDARLAALREALALPDSAQRIECFDVSHTAGEAAVASCVVYERRAMQPGEYRRYNIEGITPGDDYAAMNQALSRRYSKLQAAGAKIPDLVLIDGGAGQVASARAALAELGMNDVAVVGVAKGPERRSGKEELVAESLGGAVALPGDNPGLHLIQEIRDEAHRFALLGHRKRRNRARTTSVLTKIPGVGERRRQKLLTHFGGLQGVQAAAIDEIARVEGIGRALAEHVYRHLHQGGEGR